MKYIFRKKKLINSGLQLKMIAVFLFLSCIAALFQVILLNRSILSLAKHMPTDGDIMMSELPGLLVGNMAMTLGVLMPMMLVVGVLITHRIAGPIYRFERYLEAVARGEQNGPCSIREDDELQPLCDKLNAAITHLRLQIPEGTEEESADQETPAAEQEATEAA